MSTRAGAAGEFGDILTRSGFGAYLEKLRDQENAMADAIRDAAEVEKRGIERCASTWLKGLNAKYKARKITKPMFYMADLHDQAARSTHAVWAQYIDTFAAAGKRKVDKTAADPTK